MEDSRFYLWIEIEANKHRITDQDYFGRVLDRCFNAGVGSVILSVKDTTGFCIYRSRIVPHYSKYDCSFEDMDYLQTYIDMAHNKGLKLFAAVDVFAEGKIKTYHPLSPGHAYTEWQTSIYGINGYGAAVIQPVGDVADIRTIGSIDDFDEIFVNPVREDVRDYELGIIKELADSYDMDGIILDRARFIGLGSDFSCYTRAKFEEYICGCVKEWPEEIYKLELKGNDLHISHGPLFGKWITFRSGIIKDFITEAGRIVKESAGDMQFIDYTGSWYPLYYLVGANWASAGYTPEEYPWVQSEYSWTGYAESLDMLLSGFYYPEVTINDAVRCGKPAYWYSVEGAGDMVKKVVGDAVPFVGSLFLKQYEGRPEVFEKAIDMCFKKSYGCMLFDLSYIEDYDWWQFCRKGG